MKNILSKSILSILVLLTTFGCQDELERLYQNPDGFSKAQADKAGVSVIAGYFTSQLTRGYLYRGDYGMVFHTIRSGSLVMGTGLQPGVVTNATGIAYTLRNVEQDWGSDAFNTSVFNFLNTEWISQILWAQSEFNKMAEGERSKMDILFMNLLTVTKAYAYQIGRAHV